MAREFSGEKLRSARMTAGLRPEQLAFHVGRSVYAVHEYERGRARPSVAVLARIADKLAVPIDALFVEAVATDAP